MISSWISLKLVFLYETNTWIFFIYHYQNIQKIKTLSVPNNVMFVLDLTYLVFNYLIHTPLMMGGRFFPGGGGEKLAI